VAVGTLTGNRLTPHVEASQSRRGNEVATIFPAEVCGKFSGKRLRVSTRLTYREPSAFALLLWRGRATINVRPARAGEEYFVSARAALAGIEIANVGDGLVELFAFAPSI
jgi:hypothetical protein